MTQIKDIGLTKTEAAADDWLILQTPSGETYKIKIANLLAGFSSAPVISSNTVFVSNFSSSFVSDIKGHPIEAHGNAFISSTESKFDGKSIYFDGDGDYLQLNASNDWSFGTGDFTIQGWLRPTDRRSDNGRDNVFASTAVFNSSGWQLEINSGTSDGNKAVSFFIGQYQNRIFIDEPEWVNAWKYVAIKRTSGILEMRLDGVLKKSLAYAYDVTNTQPLVIGRAGLAWDATHFWKGFCGGLKISKSALDVSIIPTQPFTV